MSLYKKLVIGGCLFTAVIFCGNVYVTQENAREQYHNQLSAHAQDTATALGLSLTANIDDPVTTELMVNAIFDSGYFYRIRVTDIRTHQVLIERNNVPPSANVPGWFVRLVHLDPGRGEATVMRGWTQAAQVEVISHPMFALSRLWHGLLASFLLLSGCSLVFMLLTALVLRGLLRPLDFIVEQATAISRREFLTLPTLPRTPELRRVVEATNMMVTGLKARFSEQASRIETLHEEAYSDSLTGLKNRRAFDIRLQSWLSDDERQSGYLLLLRVQDLVGLNQRLGGARTDKLLQAVAVLLNELQAQYLNNKGVLARIRGGEFAIIAPPVIAQQMDNLTTALSRQLESLYATGLSDVSPAACFARVAFSHGDTPQTVLMQADQALTRAETGTQFTAEPTTTREDNNSDDHHHWLNRLERVLGQESFELFSQPVYQCNKQKIILHRKILARIKTDNGEIIPAGRFMPWVHHLGLSQRMDIVMLRQTLKAMEKGTDHLALSISGESVADDASINALLQPLKQARHLANRLTLELDENALPPPERITVLVHKLKALGCGLGIQHFGGRFHLIGNLPQWGLAWLKVDSGFIRNIDQEEDKRLFIEATYWATRQINLPLIAERVETEGELQVLEDIGLYGAMGRYFNDASTFTQS
ncbi:LapD/MoxY N-terminal periplasmic domain-containing protein [Shimwellia blattae]|uniref:Putative diguanylate cyclase (GGDEF) domain protein n=1 Tax=Shimwellia blattae (strain ATCC 29907 / DSM 4481 / JCM 1650 / NBRC 105725 / CDC 9005-74) TaxID=630626 RepID=I2BCB1_SHIBC|nr:LapD/MoxY N-terminal periplasmic domain-containing protein [Shimwellia blattae]AFJ48165.1 putative diguanylate cyclase (GGDEF) domain protein [Shimwellia blattae DSM 4481 = NBRC 105725]GAB82725.1 putative cyclic di-GMP phosphodiesterase [Shimwellia blattae DSM 4481 = NBRC 105725]VDY65663.1 Regulator of CsrB and CsrC decay CsrD [Shimwellia blattae]VEC25278.1 Regulator of CsrB and CsrC decay CsrD [Shimwellia blattae]